MNKVEIANLSLAALGQEPISSFDEANDRARKIKLFFEISRKDTLRAFDWGFAAAEEKGALLFLGTGENGENKKYSAAWPYVYCFPQNCLKVKKMFLEDEEPCEFKQVYLPDLKQKGLAAKVKGLTVAYTADIDDCSVFDDMFVSAFSLKLAAQLAVPLTGDKQTAQMFYSLAEREIAKAQTNSRQENKKVLPRISPSVLGRG